MTTSVGSPAPGPLVIENCAIATMDGARHDDSGTEYRTGHTAVADGRITAVGDGPPPVEGLAGASTGTLTGARRVDGTGCLATPGLVNTHHHLYQWLTQGRAQQSVLFDWLTELYPVWARIDPARCMRRRPRAWPGWPCPAAPPAPTTTTSSRRGAAGIRAAGGPTRSRPRSPPRGHR